MTEIEMRAGAGLSASCSVDGGCDTSEESDLAALPAERVRIYLNNAATTWPKPEGVIRAVEACLRSAGSAMRQDGSVEGGLMESCRRDIARFFGADSPDRIILLPGCTYALNLALHGLVWEPGDAIVISGMEHHAVSRPARKLADRLGVRLEVSPYRPGEPFDLGWLESVLAAGGVKLVATTMASNLTGEVLPSREIVRLAREHGALSLLDAAQAAGVIPVDVVELGCDMLAFAGHKGLMGPLGVGGLYLREGLSLDTLAEGGTGGDSGCHVLSGRCPSTYEVGSHNLPAIAGLAAGVRWVESRGVDEIHRHEAGLCARLRSALLADLSDVCELRLLGADGACGRTGVVSFGVDGLDAKRIAAVLADADGIACRAGFHCAPMAHESIGTLATGGAVRLSPGAFNTEAEIDTAAAAVGRAVRSLLG